MVQHWERGGRQDMLKIHGRYDSIPIILSRIVGHCKISSSQATRDKRCHVTSPLWPHTSQTVCNSAEGVGPWDSRRDPHDLISHVYKFYCNVQSYSRRNKSQNYHRFQEKSTNCEILWGIKEWNQFGEKGFEMSKIYSLILNLDSFLMNT